MVDIPAFRIRLAGVDVTPNIAHRLVSLSITEARGEEADQLDLTITDHDGRLAIPAEGSIVSVALGWEGRALVDKGLFKLDEPEHSGPPDIITVRGRAADFTDALRVRRDQSWTETTLGEIVGELAGRNGLSAHVAPELAARRVAHLAQSRESDANLLTRLGRQYDAAATMKAGRLLFSPIGRGTTPSGRAIPSLTIYRTDQDRHSWKRSARESYAGVKANYHDVGAGKRGTVEIAGTGGGSEEGAGGSVGEVKQLRQTFASEADARTHAESEATRLARGKASLSLSLALGRPEIYPEQRVQVVGWKPEIDGGRWLVKSATHSLAPGGEGLTTSLELETG